MALINNWIDRYTNQFDSDFKKPNLVFFLMFIISVLLLMLIFTFLANKYSYYLVKYDLIFIALWFWSLSIMVWTYITTQLLHYKMYKRFFKLIKPDNKVKRIFIKSVLYTLLIITIQTAVMYSLKTFFWWYETQRRNDMSNVVFNIWFIALLLFPLIWAFEEFVFRWVIQQVIISKLKFLNYKTAWVVWVSITSILFTSLHISQTTNFELISIFLISFILWMVFFVYKDIRLNMLMHAFNNLFFVSIVFISTSWINQVSFDIKNQWLNNSSIFVAQSIWENPYRIRYLGYSLLDAECRTMPTSNDVLVIKDYRDSWCDIETIRKNINEDLEVLNNLNKLETESKVPRYVLDNLNMIKKSLENK